MKENDTFLHSQLHYDNYSRAPDNWRDPIDPDLESVCKTIQVLEVPWLSVTLGETHGIIPARAAGPPLSFETVAIDEFLAEPIHNVALRVM